ncbi:MAG: lipase family protein [Lachnospiraceae bacterium]|nr:lipase family protein [Lachnospiraceae bacterium]
MVNVRILKKSRILRKVVLFISIAIIVNVLPMQKVSAEQSLSCSSANWNIMLDYMQRQDSIYSPEKFVVCSIRGVFSNDIDAGNTITIYIPYSGNVSYIELDGIKALVGQGKVISNTSSSYKKELECFSSSAVLKIIHNDEIYSAYDTFGFELKICDADGKTVISSISCIESNTENELKIKEITSTFHSDASTDQTSIDIPIKYKWGMDYFERDNTIYNHDLGIAALLISHDVYNESRIESRLLELGCESDSIRYSNGYDEKWYARPGTVFGYRKYFDHYGCEKTLLIVSVRGTNNPMDVLTDIVDGGTDEFDLTGKMCFSSLENYCNEFNIDLLSPNTNLFITGHSLGGAVANRLAVELKNKNSKARTYIYTFAAARNSRKPTDYSLYGSLLAKVENPGDYPYIFNIINKNDIIPYIPGYGVHLGKELYYDANETKYNTLRNAFWNTSGNVDHTMYDHLLTTYIFCMLTEKPSSEKMIYNNAKFLSETSDKIDKLCQKGFFWIVSEGLSAILKCFIACPVDVEVKDKSGNIVCYTLDGVAYNNNPDIAFIIVEGEDKHLYILKEDEVDVHIIGNDAGTMDYSVSNYNIFGELVEDKSFSGIEITDGKIFKAEVPEESVLGTALVVVDESDNNVAEVKTDGSEIKYADHILIDDVGYEATCTEPGLTKGIHCSDCGEIVREQIVIPALGHSWSEWEEDDHLSINVCRQCDEKLTYTWSEDFSSLKAERFFKDEDSPSVTEIVDVTENIIEQPTCTQSGSKKYTSTSFNNSCFKVQTKVTDVSAIGHDWGEPEYVWSDDNSTITATRTCKNDTNHTESETVDTVKSIKTKEDGTEYEEYSATFVNDVFKDQTKEIEIPVPEIEIFSQPEDVVVEANKMSYFSVKATGKGLTYLWQYKKKGKSEWVDWTTKTTSDISVAYSSDRNDMSLRCMITDLKGRQCFSETAILKYSMPLVIAIQPENTTVKNKELAYFSVKATGNGLKYLWQYKKKGVENWTDWATKTTSDISVAYSSDRDGMALRCVITDSVGKKVVSDEAILTYDNESSYITIAMQPKNTTVMHKELAYFNVKAAGSGLRYLWQYKKKGASTWTDWTTKTTSDISVAYSSDRNGMSLRCLITDETGKTLITKEAVLTYSNNELELAITAHPENAAVVKNQLAYFSVQAVGRGLKYLWQYKSKGSDTWTDWTSKTTSDISVAYSKDRDGMSLRCVVTDGSGNKIVSNEASLTYSSGESSLSFTKQPKDMNVVQGELAYFSVKVSGSGLKYLWQYKNKGASSWTDWTSKTKPDISVAYSKDRDGMSLRCMVTDGSGNTVTSNEAVLTYSSGTFAITTQPQSTTVAANSLAYFSVKASGSGLTYLWQYKYKGSDNWTNWTSKTKPDISVAYSKERDGMSLRCIVTDLTGNTLTSDVAVLNYN